MTQDNRKLLLAVRRGLLMIVDALEVYLGLPRTSQIRKESQGRFLTDENTSTTYEVAGNGD